MDAESLAKTNASVSKLTSDDSVDMVAASADGTTAVIVAVTEPNAQNTGKTAQDFLDAQVKELESGLQGTYAYESSSADITFNGMSRTIPAAITTITAEGKTLVIGQAVAEKNGAFLDVIVTGTNEADVTKAFEAFKATAD